MESYGELLKKERESKNLSLEIVERDTTITKQYLVALETEDDGAFPGEPYLVGFLKNYAEYLGMDSNELLTLYHSKKIQEAPVPQELLARHKPKFLAPLIISVSVLLLIGIGIYLYLCVFKVPQVREEHAKTIAENTKVHQYTFKGSVENHRLYKGDQIIVPSGNGKGNIILTVSDTLGSLTLQTPAGDQIIDLSEERELDVDGNGESDLIVYLSDISRTDAQRGAEVRMLLKNAESIKAAEQAVSEESEESDIESDTEASSNAISTSETKQTVILEDTRAYPFTVNVVFRGSCVFRYRIDRQSNVEDYYKSGEVVNVTASNGVRLWMSNINAMKIQIIADTVTYDLEVGKAGQVKVEDIKWIRDGDGKYRLVVVELD